MKVRCPHCRKKFEPEPKAIRQNCPRCKELINVAKLKEK